MKQRKPQKCKVCSTEFIPFQSMQKVCGGQCALTLAREQKEEQARVDNNKKLRLRKRDVKPLNWFKSKAQSSFNAYIRERDSAYPCISCQRHHDGQYHAGHFRPSGSHSELTFHEDNVHKQCAPCNTHLSGNLTHYRIHLISKIGLQRVEWLEKHHKPVKYTRENYEHIERVYKDKLKELKSKHFQ